MADAIAAAIGDAIDGGPDARVDREAVGEAVWPLAMRRTRVFHEMGLNMLLRLGAAGQSEFSATFFDLPVERWRSFLRTDATPGDTGRGHGRGVQGFVVVTPASSRRSNAAALARLLRP